MQMLPIAVVAALAALATKAPSPVTRVVHEKRDHVPKAWVKRDRMDSSASLPVRIGLTQSNLDRGHDTLMGV